MPKVNLHQETIKLKKSIPELSLAILTDIHLNITKKSHTRFSEAIQIVNDQKPDLIFILGDFLTDLYSRYEKLEKLKTLQAKHGVFAVLGNHDNGVTRKFMKNKRLKTQRIQNMLKDCGIKNLTNQKELLKINNQELYLVGVDDYWSDDFSLEIMKDLPADYPVILLSHNPDVVLELTKNYPTDLVVSGHTHGYSVRLPKIGPITTAKITKLGRKYDKGLKEYQDRLLYICSGVGGATRIFNKPQVSLLRVK